MNEEILLKFVSPFVEEKRLSRKTFDEILNMLSLDEKKDALEVLKNRKIEVIDTIDDVEKLEYCEEDYDYYNDKELLEKKEQSSSAIRDSSYECEQNTNLINKEYMNMSNDNLIVLMQQGDMKAKSIICVRNKNLVYKIAHERKKNNRYKGEIEDLVQEGFIGLIKSAERFDFSFGTKFSTYATFYIRNSIDRYIMGYGNLVHIPVHVFEYIKKILALDIYYEVMGNSDSECIKKISEDLLTTEEDIRYHLNISKQFLNFDSLNKLIGEDEETELLDLIPCDYLNVEEKVDEITLKNDLEELISTLKPREQGIIRLRFGFEDGNPMSLEEIGKIYGVTRERIRQIEKKALSKLKVKIKRSNINI